MNPDESGVRADTRDAFFKKDPERSSVMLALASVWIATATLLLSLAMLIYRPAFTDLTVMLVVYFGAPGAICLAGLTLWAHRNDGPDDLGVTARRLQSKVAITLAILAAAIVYALVALSDRVGQA